MSNAAQEKFEELIKIVKRLKAPDGCPWDREQTNASLLPYFLEEAYEVIESVDNENCFMSYSKRCLQKKMDILTSMIHWTM